MIQNVVEKIGGVGAYGAISICLFFAVFAGAMLYALCYRKSVCTTMSSLPLDDGETAGLETCAAQKGASHE